MLVLASISESLVNVAWHFVRDAGLPAIFVLMLAESACVPIPSEATMLFAGFAVADPGSSSAHHHLTLPGIVAAGVAGNLLGSWLAYGVGRAGRLELVERHGRWLHIQPRQLAWADRWFARYGAAAVFFSRMLPIVRTFISLPAGVALQRNLAQAIGMLHRVHTRGVRALGAGPRPRGRSRGRRMEERAQRL